MSLQRLSSDLAERVSSVFERQRSGVESSYITRTTSNRSTVSRAEAEKRGETHVNTARTWKSSGHLHDEATAIWVIPSCVTNPMSAAERAEDAQRRATTAAAFLSSIQRSATEAPTVEGEEAGACFMSALLTAHSSGAMRIAPPTKMMPPTPVASAPTVSSVSVTPSPAPLLPPNPVAVKRERSPSAEAATASEAVVSAPPVDEQPVEKKAPRTEAPKSVPTTTATKPAPKTSKSKKAPVAGQMKLNFAKLMPVAATPAVGTTPKPTVPAVEDPVAQIILPPAPPPISSENDELFMPDEGDFENQHTCMPTISEPTSTVAETYEVREGERQANDILSSVNDDLIMGSFDEPTPTPKPTDAFGALMGKPKTAGVATSSTPKAATAASQASANTMKQSSMMGALFNPALVAFQKQFEKRTKNLMKRKPDGSTEFQQITIRVRLGPVKDGKPTVLEEMTEEEFRQQCDVVIQQNKVSGTAPLQQMTTNVSASKNPFASH